MIYRDCALHWSVQLCIYKLYYITHNFHLAIIMITMVIISYCLNNPCKYKACQITLRYITIYHRMVFCIYHTTSTIYIAIIMIYNDMTWNALNSLRPLMKQACSAIYYDISCHLFKSIAICRAEVYLDTLGYNIIWIQHHQRKNVKSWAPIVHYEQSGWFSYYLF